jgi:hypothetical protein
MKKVLNTKKENRAKRIYKKPVIERIKMDYQLSVLMASDDPPGDPELYFNANHFDTNPFKLPKI